MRPKLASFYAITVIILLWCVGGMIFDLNKSFLPFPTGVAKELWVELFNGELLKNCGATLGRAIGGFGTALVAGVGIGVLLGNRPKWRTIFGPLLDFIRSVPTSMLFPLVILFFGLGEAAKFAIAVIGTAPMLTAVTAKAVAGSSATIERRTYLKLHSHRLSAKIRFMAAMEEVSPALIAASKIAVSIALVLVIVTEMFFTARSGLGYAAHQAYLAFNLEKMYLQIIVVGFLGVALNFLFDFLLHITGAKHHEE